MIDNLKVTMCMRKVVTNTSSIKANGRNLQPFCTESYENKSSHLNKNEFSLLVQ